MAILEIVYRAVKDVGDDYGICTKGQIEVAEPLADKIVELVALQGMNAVPPTLVTPDLEVFNFLNEVLDIVEPSIPIVRSINVTLTTSRFAERGLYHTDGEGGAAVH